MKKIRTARVRLNADLRDAFYKIGYEYPRCTMMQHVWSTLYEKLPRVNRLSDIRWEELSWNETG